MAASRYDNYRPHANDYSKTDKTTGAGLFEIQGDRGGQEDRMVATHLPGFDRLSSSDKENVFKRTVAKMQSKFGKTDAGSTLATSVGWKEENRVNAFSAHVGDSESFLVIVNKNRIVNCVNLTPNLHKPNDENEKKRLEKNKATVRGGRVWGRHKGLSLSRAIGDQDVLTHADDHEADFNTAEIALENDDDQAFLITMCDGIMENVPRDEVDSAIAKIIFENQASPELAAQKLVEFGYNRGSTDNMSVAVVPITSTKPVSISVFDGHGGDEVSNNLGNDFYPALREKINRKVG